MRFALLNPFKPSSKIFYGPFQGGTSFVDLLCCGSVLCLLCLCASLFICALWSPAQKGLTSWFSLVVSNCESVTFPLASWVRCGTYLTANFSTYTLIYRNSGVNIFEYLILIKAPGGKFKDHVHIFY